MTEGRVFDSQIVTSGDSVVLSTVTHEGASSVKSMVTIGVMGLFSATLGRSSVFGESRVLVCNSS